MSKPIPADANVISNPYVLNYHPRRGNDKLEPTKNRYFRSGNGNTWVCALVANLGRMAYALENATNATGVTGVLTITKYVEA